MKLDLYNDHLEDEEGFQRIDIVLTKLSVLECNDEWANSQKGRESLAGMILEVNPPQPDEIKRVLTIEDGIFKRFRLFIKRPPCPVIYLGDTFCPICGGTHE